MSAYIKDILREIKSSAGRFISLLIISALGSASVVGIQATSIDMRLIADKTYKAQNLYDIQLKSTVGFGDGDVDALRGSPGVRIVMPTYMYDVYVFSAGEVRTVRTYALSGELNKVTLLYGRLPETDGECAVEQSLLRAGGYAIGDTVELGLDDMDDYDEVIANREFTITGVVESPFYLTSMRGNTSLGDGRLGFYLYLHSSAYTLEVYTDVFLLMDGSQSMDNLTDEYDDAAAAWSRGLEATGDARVLAKRGEYADAQREIDDGWVEYYDGERELAEKVADGYAELSDAKAKLDDAAAELRDAQEELDDAVADGRREIDENRRTIEDGYAEIEESRAVLADGQAELDSARAELDGNLAALEATAPRGASPVTDAYYTQIDEGYALLKSKQAELDAGYTAIAEAERELADGLAQLDEAERTLERERADGQRKIDDGWVEYYVGVAEYEDGLDELMTAEADGIAELEDAKAELEDAQEKLDSAPEPEWYYFTRADGVSFDSYRQDTLRLQKIGYVFPLVFFFVAVLVSLTTMSRMVEEQRTQIGVYKALGYRSSRIMLKYLIYAFVAGAAGGALGVAVGSYLFPSILTDAYRHLYTIPPIDRPIPVLTSAVAVASSVCAVLFITLITCLRSMRNTPAELMRPKSPPEGKRVLVERITPLWNRVGFIGKVTARNIFRYKKRFIMTLVGVAGCSALLLTAFGLRDSISGVAELQYTTLSVYGSRAYLKDITSEQQRRGIDALLPDGGSLYIREESAVAEGSASVDASIIVPEFPEKLDDFIRLRDWKSGEVIEFRQDGVVITAKLARETGVSAGDELEFTASGGRTYRARVSAVTENYILHYIYMPPGIYAELFGALPPYNSVLLESASADTLLSGSDVRALVVTDDLRESIGRSTDALSVVTVVLIVLACALALVVLFNLTNINITERLRELATIKVLGFYESELAMYIYRENALVTAMGIALGLVGGIYLNGFVLSAAEIDLLMFPHIIKPQSYLYAVSLSLVFAVFVNLVMNLKLSRINMVESLKSVE